LNSKHSSNCSLERGIGGKPGPLTSGCPPSAQRILSRIADPRIYEEFCNSRGKPRLLPTRKILLDPRNLEDLGFSSFEDALDFLMEIFSLWRDRSEFMVFRGEYVGRGEPRADRWKAVKCSKRGNDVYQRRIKTRLGWLDREIPDHKFFELRDFQVDRPVKTSLLWITLTYDPSHSNGSLIYAWENLGKDFNRLMSALRRKYGKTSYMRVWESYESGFPHVHAVMMFKEAEFSVFPRWSEKENKLTFRIMEKEEIAGLWHSFVDVQAISSTRAVFTYLKKHQEKVILGLSGSIQDHAPCDPTVGFDLENVKGLLTLALTWVFRKRSFSVSGDFREKLSDLISNLHNSNMKGQRDLEGNLVREWIWSLVGIFSGSELGIPSGIWGKEFEKEEVIRLLEDKGMTP